MKIALQVLAALLLIVPAIAGGQALTDVAPVADSTPGAYATIKANRAGLSADERIKAPPLVRGDPTLFGHNLGPRLRHAGIGVGVGGLAGAVIGVAVGARMDSQSGDDFLSAPVLMGLIGASGGLALGAIIGFLWPVK